MHSSILAKGWLYFERQFRLTLLLLLKDSHELVNLINLQPIKRHNNNVFEPLHKKGIIQLVLGKLRFVISMESQERYIIRNIFFFHDSFNIFFPSFNLEITYIDGGIIITFNVFTSSGCKTVLIID